MQFVTQETIAAEMKNEKFTLLQFAVDSLNGDVVQFLMRFVVSSEPIKLCLQRAREFEIVSEQNPARRDELQETAGKFSALAVRLFNSIDSEYEAMWVLEDTVLDKALEWQNHKFVANPRVVKIAQNWWQTSYVTLPTGTTQKTLPQIIISSEHTPSLLFSDFSRFSRIPKIKFLTESLAFFAFVLLFSAVITLNIQLTERIHGLEITVWLWGLGFLVGEILQLRADGQTIAAYLSDGWNQVDLLTILMLLVMAICRLIAASQNDELGLDGLYTFTVAVCILTMVMRLLVVLWILPSIGPLIITLKKMLGDIARWVLLMVVFLYGFTFALIFVIRGDSHALADQKSNTFNGIFLDWYQSESTLLLMVQASLSGDIPWDTLDALSGSRQWLAQFLFIIYLILSVIVLVNLLIAMMSQSYGDVQAISTEVSLFSFVSETVERQGEDTIPAPLNLIVELFLGMTTPCQLVKTKADKTCKTYSRCEYCSTKMCSCEDPSEQCKIKYLHSYAYYDSVICPVCFRSSPPHKQQLVDTETYRKKLRRGLSLAVFAVFVPALGALLLFEKLFEKLFGGETIKSDKKDNKKQTSSEEVMKIQRNVQAEEEDPFQTSVMETLNKLSNAMQSNATRFDGQLDSILTRLDQLEKQVVTIKIPESKSRGDAGSLELPLHKVVQWGNTQLVELLIKNGAGVNVGDEDGISALHVAAREGQVSICEVLIKAGADVNLKDKNEQTPLHLAAAAGQTEVVSLLMRHNADPALLNKDGKRPADLATGSTKEALLISQIVSLTQRKE